MTVTLVLTSAIAREIANAAMHPLETAGVLLAGVVRESNGDTRLLGRKIHWVNDSAYLKRERASLSIASEGYVHALGDAEVLGAMAIWIHTHPGPSLVPMPSVHDQVVDREISDLFRLRSGSDYYGAAIFSSDEMGLSFSGHLDGKNNSVQPIDRIWVVGDRFQLIRSFDSKTLELSPIFDRNVRAFGGGIQQTLGELHVGLVGCGGTGSSVAEQLVRLGVRHFTLIDPDKLSASNVTRVYGSVATDVDKLKVDILAAHLLRIAPEVECEKINSTIAKEAVARRLTGCDIVFGCTDDNAGRLVLSRLATYHLIPVIDCGVLISSDDGGHIIGIDGRITTLVPGQACLVCRRRVDLARAAAELLTPDERMRREDEGYAPALGAVEPAVVTYTTMVAASAVSELLERLSGYGPDPRPSEVILRCHEREISTNVAVPVDGHYCHPASGKIGIGVVNPFLGQAWPT